MGSSYSSTMSIMSHETNWRVVCGGDCNIAQPCFIHEPRRAPPARGITMQMNPSSCLSPSSWLQPYGLLHPGGGLPLTGCSLCPLHRWVFIYEKGYQSTDTAVSSVFSKMKGVGYTNVNGSERVWDVADYVFPSQVGGWAGVLGSARACRRG